MLCHLASFHPHYQTHSIYAGIPVAVSQTSTYNGTMIQQCSNQILMDEFQNSKIHLSTQQFEAQGIGEANVFLCLESSSCQETQRCQPDTQFQGPSSSSSFKRLYELHAWPSAKSCDYKVSWHTMLTHFSYVPQMPGVFPHDKFWILLFLTTELKIKCWCRTMSVGSLGTY